MQRNDLLAGALAGVFALISSTVPAQDATTAAAEREEAEANYKRMSVKVEQLEESFHALQKSLKRIADEVGTLREQVDTLKNRNESAGMQDSIKHLAEKIEEVDAKRRADGELVSKKFTALGKDLSKTLVPKDPAPVKDPTPAPVPKKEEKNAEKNPSNASSPPEKAYAYKIKDGDTLTRIVTELRAQGYKTTQKQVMDANPAVNWSKLKIGQTVFVPPPNP